MASISAMKIARYPLFEKEGERERGTLSPPRRRRWFHFKGEMNQIFHEEDEEGRRGGGGTLGKVISPT